MKVLALCIAFLWPGLLFAEAGGRDGDPATPYELVASVERATMTPGFRLRATLMRDGDEPGQSLRVLIAGEKDSRRHRLMIRALGPEAWRNKTVVVESGAGVPVHAASYGMGDGTAAAAVNAFSAVFGSALVPWHLTGEWWRWPRQAKVREEAMLGQDCVIVESRGGPGPVVRVRSWIAPQLRMPARVEFYGAEGLLLGTIRVTRYFRRADGSGAARTMVISDGRDGASRFEIYSGEEGIELAADTFLIPGAPTGIPVRDAK
jgi:hypothetical protein